ncbi:type II toxin-antitoxin system HigB family toxin [Cylindrospermum sp. FACHB-282]|uniref:type II toxin-antitoxin system HigB family toxin n=1 Tax=Cylindrospermum sp. FACHB-282 TaxID=2692794 RepID=UPI001688B34D|nr:type II toxin-antitoxin system HigB family toxin [Cylindrospermum sp. FACHB-282]MBD2384354.1 type II toxin-antitoxin system HigB family toxin [Cylindrospermum sp. FACHB-282]
MKIIGIEYLSEFGQVHPDAEVPLDVWHQIAEKAEWKHIIDVREVYPHADFVEGYTVFNIGGNKYRLIAKITYIAKTIKIESVLTHSDYDEGKWKK